MNFANVTDWRIPEGDVIRVTDSQNRVIWEKNENPEPQYNKPFWIQCNNSCTLILSRYDSAQASTVSQNNIDVYYSTDLVNWTFWGTTYWSRDLELNILANTKYYFKAVTPSWSKYKSGNDYAMHRFEAGNYGSSSIFYVGGNILSLLYGDDYQQYSTLKNIEYSSLTNFTRFVKTNAKYLALPLVCTQDYEYDEMLPNCSFAPLLPSTIVKKRCYYRMFVGGTLIKAPVLPATTLAEGCYAWMFYGCSNLVTAPDLNALTLVNGCYYGMFSRCTSLSNIKCLATSGINQDSSTFDWLTNVSATGTFTKATGTTWPTGAAGIPSGWTVVEQ